MRSVVLDTGALIAHERRSVRTLQLFKLARDAGLDLVVPVTALGEWYAGGPRHGLGRDRDGLTLVPLDAALATSAGNALAELRLDAVHFVDATVMATAAVLGAAVYTSDMDDLQRLQTVFREVRLFAV